jgi:hypothetical protein
MSRNNLYPVIMPDKKQSYHFYNYVLFSIRYIWINSISIYRSQYLISVSSHPPPLSKKIKRTCQLFSFLNIRPGSIAVVELIEAMKGEVLLHSFAMFTDVGDVGSPGPVRSCSLRTLWSVMDQVIGSNGSWPLGRVRCVYSSFYCTTWGVTGCYHEWKL